MIGKTIEPELRELIEKRDLETLRQVFDDWHPSEIADLLGDLPEQEVAVLFRILPPALSADTFEYLDLASQQKLLKWLGREEVASVVNEMSPDDRTALLEELPGPVCRQLLEYLTPGERAVAQTLLGYPEGSVGRLMTPGFISVPKEWSVGEVMEHVRRVGRDTETLNNIYVLDEKGLLIDDIRLSEFILSPLDRHVADLMDGNYVSLLVTDSKEHAVEVFRKYDRAALPVVNADRYLIGVVTIDDVLDVVAETDTEDIHKFGGSEALDYPYKATPVLSLVKKRAGWLVILFLGEMLTATAMGYFEAEIARAVVLALFVPLIISSGGNSGSQAATLVIRAMALGELRLRDWVKVLRRELLSGLLLGSVLGAIGFLRIEVWSMFTNLYGEHSTLVALTVGCALVGVVTWGTISGSMLPFLLRRLGFDPAASSAPFVATLVDVTGLVIYFSVAAVVLRGTLL